jgi:hypothetical protein
MTAAPATGWITMNPMESTTAAGEPATKWRPSAAAIIAQSRMVAAQRRTLSEPRPHPAQCRPFRQDRVLGEAVDTAVVADVADHPG